MEIESERMREVHADFKKHLIYKEQELIENFLMLRKFILSLNPMANELLYHTHALSALYSISQKMSDGYCMIVVYQNHINLAFNKGRLLEDPRNLLKGDGKLMRHLRVNKFEELPLIEVEDLIKQAMELAFKDSSAKVFNEGLCISKIKQ